MDCIWFTCIPFLYKGHLYAKEQHPPISTLFKYIDPASFSKQEAGFVVL